jgi:hypothetical protein
LHDIRIIKQMMKEFNRQINSRFAEKITIKYQIKKATETNQKWTIGEPGQYENVPCLDETISNAGFVDTQTASTIIGKNNYYIPYVGYEFFNDEKRSISVIDAQGLTHPIDKVLPLVPVINGYLCWILIQK